MPPSSLTDAGVSGKEAWTLAATIDELVVELGSCTEELTDDAGCTIQLNKYRQQAFRLRPVMSVAEPTPVFRINLTDLSEKMRRQLHALDKDSRQYVITQAVGTLFENLSPTLYHLSLARKLRVKLLQ